SDPRVSPGSLSVARILGFAMVAVTNNQIGQTSKAYYRQDQPYEHSIDHVNVYNAASKLISATNYTYDIKNPATGTEFVRTVYVLADTYEVGTYEFFQSVQNTYDDFGNITTQSLDASSLPNTTITTTYSNDTTNW